MQRFQLLHMHMGAIPWPGLVAAPIIMKKGTQQLQEDRQFEFGMLNAVTSTCLQLHCWTIEPAGG